MRNYFKTVNKYKLTQRREALAVKRRPQSGWQG